MKSIFHAAFLCMVLCVSTISFGAKLPSLDASNEATSKPDNSLAAISETPAVSTAPSYKDAFSQFRSLSRAERKDRIRAAKDELKQYKADKKAGNAAASTNTLLLVILAILLPPLAVYLHEGVINTKFWVDLLLTLLFFIPGVIYALIVVLGNG